MHSGPIEALCLVCRKRHQPPMCAIPVVTQLPMDIPAVARWYDNVALHTESPDHDSDNQDGFRGCIRLRDEMRRLRVVYADRLVGL